MATSSILKADEHGISDKKVEKLFHLSEFSGWSALWIENTPFARQLDCSLDIGVAKRRGAVFPHVIAA